MSRQSGAALNLPSYAADPTVPTLRSGDAYWNSLSGKPRVYNGTAWQDWSANSAATIDVPVLAPGTESSITLPSAISLASVVQVRRKSDRVVVPNVIVRVIDATHLGVTGDVVTTAGQYEVVYGGPTAASVQATNIIDSCESNNSDTAGILGTSWVNHKGLALVIPAGVPFVLHFVSTVAVFQNSAPTATLIYTDIQILNSVGTKAGLGTPHRQGLMFMTTSNGIDMRDTHYRVPMAPLAAEDIFIVQSTATSLGAGTKSQAIIGQVFGVVSPQQFWAEVGV